MDLDSELVKPVQWISRYPLFFSDLSNLAAKLEMEETSRVFRSCKELIEEVSLYAEDLMDVSKIKNFPEDDDLSRQGMLVYRGDVIIIQKNKRSSSFLQTITKTSFNEDNGHMFLFKKRLIICLKLTGRATSIASSASREDKYKFDEKINLNSMTIRDKNNILGIVCKETGKNVHLRCKEKSDKDAWYKIINGELSQLKNFTNNLTFS